MKLVHDWRRCYRWFSVQSMTIASGILATWALVPDDMKASLPPHMVAWVAIGVLTMGTIGRVVSQEKQ